MSKFNFNMKLASLWAGAGVACSLCVKYGNPSTKEAAKSLFITVTRGICIIGGGIGYLNSAHEYNRQAEARAQVQQARARVQERRAPHQRKTRAKQNPRPGARGRGVGFVTIKSDKNGGIEMIRVRKGKGVRAARIERAKLLQENNNNITV